MDAITDRTQSDIDNRTAKAYLNAADLTRIETNCSSLATILGVTITVKTNWARTDAVTPSQISRLLGNIEALRQAYYTYPATPDTPDGILHWEKLNAAEQILLDLYTLCGDNDAAKYYTGEIYSGETMGVI